MSKTTKGNDGKAPSNRKTAAKDDEVGYKKPPKSGRFVKGKSGNPRGRPRKPKPQPPRLSDAPSESYLEEEAYRTIKLRENGREIELPVTQAVYRSLITNAIKGSRLSAREFFKHLKQAEDEREKRKLENYFHFERLKHEGDEYLENCAEKGIEPRELIPHPEGIVLNRLTGEAYVNGPETPEDVKSYEFTVELRNYSLLQAAHNERRRKAQSKEREEGKICPFMFCAYWVDSLLPRRYRWEEGEDVSLYMEYQDLTKRELKCLTIRETKRLEAIQPPRQYWNPELEGATQRFQETVFGKKMQ